MGLIENIETKEVKTDFQDKLKKDTKDIKKEEKVIVAADKTTNFYKVTPETYNNLLTKNITKDYKKAEENLGDKINKDSKKIAEKLDLEDRIFATTKKPASITLVDWFKSIERNSRKSFVNFDVVDFYPSITEEDRQIILLTKKPLLYSNNLPWTKKNSEFDVGHGKICRCGGVRAGQPVHAQPAGGHQRHRLRALQGRRPRLQQPHRQADR